MFCLISAKQHWWKELKTVTVRGIFFFSTVDTLKASLLNDRKLVSWIFLKLQMISLFEFLSPITAKG